MRSRRVLVVDRNKTYAEAVGTSWAQAGWEVGTATTAAEAIEVDNRCPHDMALVQLHLEGGDASDCSGLRLCGNLGDTLFRVLMIDGPQDVGTANWIAERRVELVLRRIEYPPAQRMQIISRAFQKHERAANVSVVMKYDVGTQLLDESSVLWRHLRGDMAKDAASDVPDWQLERGLSHLFHRLFPSNIELVTLTRMPGGAGGAGIVSAMVTHSLTGFQERIVVKYGSRERIADEPRRYETYIRPLGARGFAQLRWAADARRRVVGASGLSAVAYGLVGSEGAQVPCTLSDYLHQDGLGDGDIQRMVKAIFNETCREWYHSRKMMKDYPSRTPGQLSDELGSCIFGGDWRDAVVKLAKRMNGVFPGGKDEEIAAWVKYVVEDFRLEGEMRRSVTHGDLHARNVLVLEGRPVIIDFADCGVGHPFRDFAKLEVSARFGALYRDVSGTDVRRAESTMATFDFAVEKRPPIDEIRRVMTFVKAVRNSAVHLVGGSSAERYEYLWCVVFCLLRLAKVGFVSGLENVSSASLRQQLAWETARELVDGLRS